MWYVYYVSHVEDSRKKSFEHVYSVSWQEDFFVTFETLANKNSQQLMANKIYLPET